MKRLPWKTQILLIMFVSTVAGSALGLAVLFAPVAVGWRLALVVAVLTLTTWVGTRLMDRVHRGAR